MAPASWGPDTVRPAKCKQGNMFTVTATSASPTFVPFSLPPQWELVFWRTHPHLIISVSVLKDLIYVLCQVFVHTVSSVKATEVYTAKREAKGVLKIHHYHDY